MEGNIIIVSVLVLCGALHVSGQVTCTASGRFPDPSDTTCQNYTLCVFVASNSSYIGYNYTCPTNAVFNPDTAQCTASTNYVCNVTATNTTTATSPCTADGYIADPSVTDCSAYIECVDINGTFIETDMSCPNGTLYNPNTTLCDTTYTCPASFSCASAGRFADTTDTTCQNYFFCVQGTDGSYSQYNYTCPSTSVFNPNSAVCTTSYTCTN